MEIDHLKAFYQLSIDKNYSMAAKHLFITQSALTKKIKRLEEDINVVLFTRGRNGAQLSQAGKMLLPDAIQMIKKFEEFQQFSQSISDGVQGKLAIGFGISSYLAAPNYISEFKRQNPKVNIVLNDMPSSQQIDKLLTGELQLSFSRNQDVSPPLQSLTLFSDQLAIAIHEEEVISKNNLWDHLTELNYLQLNPSRGLGLYRQINHYLSNENQSPSVAQEADDILTLLALVSARLGYTIIPASAKEICPVNVKLIPFTQKDSCWNVALIWNGEHVDQLTENFIKVVKSSLIK